jgi:hypothetical protein
VAVRSYQNVHSYKPGARVHEFNGSQSIAKHLYERKYITDQTCNQIVGNEPCPGGGKYTISDVTSFPPAGKLFVRCSLAVSGNHLPESRPDW